MVNKRRRLSSDFKALVPLEALRKEVGFSEFPSRFDNRSTQISVWKKQSLSGLPDLFSGRKDKKAEDQARDIRDLYAKIGQPTVEEALEDTLACYPKPEIINIDPGCMTGLHELNSIPPPFWI